MPDSDTPTILAALSDGADALDAEARFRLHETTPPDDEDIDEARTHQENAAALRTLRSQIEKEREFVEAAMSWCALNEESLLPAMGSGEALYSRMLRNATKVVATWRALISEKPPEEGAK